MATKIPNISAYLTRFHEYAHDLLAFTNANGIKLPGISSLRGQALALLTHPEIRGKYYLERDDADAFFSAIGCATKDSIQQFNKATGVKRMTLPRGQYCIAYPFEADMVDLDKRKNAVISGDRDTQINAIKSFYKQTIVDVPNHLWQVGHLDPTIGDASEANLAFQPPIQAKYRNRYKWDPMFLKMWPTGKELIGGKFDKYYTVEERRAMFEALKKEFETP